MNPESFEISEARIKFGNSSWEGFKKMSKYDWEKLIILEPMLKFFQYEHLPGKLQEISKLFAELAIRLADEDRTPERTVSLRKLLEAKDAAVRNRL
jgi:hypothetical protein